MQYTEDQIMGLAVKLGFNGPVTKLNDFLRSNPGAAMKFQKLSEKAQEIGEQPPIEMNQGGVVLPYAKPSYNIEYAAQSYGNDPKLLNAKYRGSLAAGEVERAKDFRDLESSTEQSQAKAAQTTVQSNQLIPSNTGQLSKTGANVSTTLPTQQKTQGATNYTAGSAQSDIQSAANKNQSAQGIVSNSAITQEATLPPDQLAQLKLQAAQQAEAREVEKPEDRKLLQGELVGPGGVDQNKVDQTLSQIEAVTGDPSKQATVQGQLEGLMQQFEGGAIPAWAAGAMRQAQETLAARGLGASSLAGQAVVQAAMEASVPIAAADAQTYAMFEQENLNRRQQAAFLAAEQRAQFLGQEFDQKFQRKVLNASKISDIANRNHDTSVQIALENARMAQTMDLANLDNRQAKVMADAAAMSQTDLANLNNRQQARVLNAKAFLDMDMANADREQQTRMLEFQEIADSILSDQAAENAAKQFNAQSENQIKTFFASLSQEVELARTAMLQSDRQFNANMMNARERFNSENAIAISQSNAEWRRRTAEVNTAAQNAVNLQNAQVMAGMSQLGFEAMIQLERDEMNYLNDALNRAFTMGENAAQRQNDLIIATMSRDAAQEIAEDDRWFEAATSLGRAAVDIATSDTVGAIIKGFF